jgi:hypothetical protein
MTNLLLMNAPPARNAASMGFALLCAVGASGCDNSESAQTDQQIVGDPTPEQLLVLEENTTLSSGFGTPNADGTFSESLATIFKGDYKDAAGNGYALELGQKDTAFSAMVGLLPDTTVGPLPTKGIASMRGVYQVAEVGKSQGDTQKYGDPLITSGRITLRADFEFGTLEGSDGVLTVDGSFSSNALTGSAYFNERQAALTGLVGEERAVGVFHGTDDATTFAGGFLVEP